MKVEIISSQCIKPSCPTPHPKTHKLSILDQFMPSIYIPVVLYYSASQSTESIIGDITQQRLKLLKESLSQVLTHFYPFAGRIKDKFTIDCNDEGVHYTEAKVSCTLVEFFNQSNFISFIYKLLPKHPVMKVGIGGYTTMAQVTCFACGGIVIGTLISHLIADGVAASFFLKNWGSNTRFDQFQRTIELPNFVSPFPRNFECPTDTNVMALCGQFLNKGKLAPRRFLFDFDAIARLRTQGCSLIVQNPTRVEVITSLLCKCIAKVFKANSSLEGPTLITHAVNMRTRASPKFPKSSMGSSVWLATALMSENEVIELSHFVIKIREALTSINPNFVKGFQGEGGFANYCEISKKLIEKALIARTSGDNYVHYTSWCNFGLYDVDFGWGKPIWVSSIGDSPKGDMFFNSVILMDTPSKNEIEVWAYLNEDDMAIFQQDEELLAFATLDPNPMQLKDYSYLTK